MIKVFEELKSISENGIYKKDGIEKWLLKCESGYHYFRKGIDDISKDFSLKSRHNIKNLEKENNYIIYKAQNQENGLVYIGATTKSINKRKNDHENKSCNVIKNDFQEAISTYGADAFTWEQIATADSTDELAQKEKEYIYEYNSKDEGYNSDCGGGIKKSVYKYTLAGKLFDTFDDLTRAGESIGTTKQHISRACLSVNKTFGGFYWSYEYKEPFVPDNDTRKKEVIQYSLDGNEIAKFNSVAEASRKCNLSKSAISRVCRGERKHGGGYHWCYS